jgi:predicted RNA-binding Zn ribbon-like protein
MPVSINFKTFKTMSSVKSHNAREAEKQPSYLLDQGQKPLIIIDNLPDKMSTLYREQEARAFKVNGRKWQNQTTRRFEGVLMFPREEYEAGDREKIIDCTRDYCAKLGARFNTKIIHVALHEDEGHIDDETGEKKYHYHAHIVLDNIDKSGKTVARKTNAKVMREIQTELRAQFIDHFADAERPAVAKKGLNHHEYRAVASASSGSKKAEKEQATKNAKAIKELKLENAKAIKEIKEQAARQRQAMIEQGDSTMADYRALKKERDEAIAELKDKAKVEIADRNDDKAKIKTLEALNSDLSHDLRQANKTANKAAVILEMPTVDTYISDLAKKLTDKIRVDEKRLSTEQSELLYVENALSKLPRFDTEAQRNALFEQQEISKGNHSKAKRALSFSESFLAEKVIDQRVIEVDFEESVFFKPKKQFAEAKAATQSAQLTVDDGLNHLKSCEAALHELTKKLERIQKLLAKREDLESLIRDLSDSIGESRALFRKPEKEPVAPLHGATGTNNEQVKEAKERQRILSKGRDEGIER